MLVYGSRLHQILRSGAALPSRPVLVLTRAASGVGGGPAGPVPLCEREPRYSARVMDLMDSYQKLLGMVEEVGDSFTEKVRGRVSRPATRVPRLTTLVRPPG